MILLLWVILVLSIVWGSWVIWMTFKIIRLSKKIKKAKKESAALDSKIFEIEKKRALLKEVLSKLDKE